MELTKLLYSIYRFHSIASLVMTRLEAVGALPWSDSSLRSGGLVGSRAVPSQACLGVVLPVKENGRTTNGHGALQIIVETIPST